MDTAARGGARRGAGFATMGLGGLVLAASVLAGAGEFTPARLRAGAVPAAPPNVTTWGWVALDVSVDTAGRPQQITRLYGAAPFAELVEQAVAAWSFDPAREDRDAVDSHVLVVVVYRPPVLLNDATAVPPTVAASRAVPAPLVITPPLYPPQVLGDAVVLLEVTVGPDGLPRERRVVQSGGGFDAAALDAAAAWRFRPAERAGVPVPAAVYLAFAFRQPVVRRDRPAPPPTAAARARR
jgi:TonB family protein